jgi:predicted RNase H-like nuclease (RuvC/YqgF family)
MGIGATEMIIGIDPGAKTGIAQYTDGKLLAMQTTDILGAITLIRLTLAKLVVLEDSTLTSHIFTAPGVPHRAALKVARNIGEVDAYCKIIKQVCGELEIPYRSISPKDKGKKIDAKDFDRITGWTSKSNQHERDAAMVAWRFRSEKAN